MSRREPRSPVTQASLAPARAAFVNGESRYFGKPCARGHSGERYASSRKCVECHRGDVQRNADKHREKVRARRKVYAQENVEVRRIKQSARVSAKPVKAPSPSPSRAAQINGESRYFGKPCRHGHAGERYSSSGKCVECHRQHKRAARVKAKPQQKRGAG